MQLSTDLNDTNENKANNSILSISSSIPEGEKTILRQKLISHIKEPVTQVATQLAVIISKIARYFKVFL